MSVPLGRNYWKLWVASVVSNFGDGVATIAYPWLASAVTRNPIHIAAVLVVTRLPWLLFSLPAGVITDRVDRRKLVAWMDVGRFVITLGVALAVLAAQPQLSSPEEVAAGGAVPDSAGLLLLLIYAAAMLLGTAEVFRDNSAQTLMPAIVDGENLEKANGRLWGAEMVTNSFVGPPLGGLLLAVAFALPFFVDAGSFAVAAALVFMIGGNFKPSRESADTDEIGKPSFWGELKEGVAWLWGHDLFRPMAIALGVINALFMVAFSTYVLYVQEVLKLDATTFGLLLTAAAAGGVLGSLVAPRVSGAIGQGASLFLTILVSAGALMITGLTSSFWVVWVMIAVFSSVTILWNVITVSLRQALIPDAILGRVNSVYRFIGWGMMPIGSLLGGVIVLVAEPALGREMALRAPFFFAAAANIGLYLYALPRLNTSRIEKAKQEGGYQERAESSDVSSESTEV